MTISFLGTCAQRPSVPFTTVNSKEVEAVLASGSAFLATVADPSRMSSDVSGLLATASASSIYNYNPAYLLAESKNAPGFTELVISSKTAYASDYASLYSVYSKAAARTDAPLLSSGIQNFVENQNERHNQFIAGLENLVGATPIPLSVPSSTVVRTGTTTLTTDGSTITSTYTTTFVESAKATGKTSAQTGGAPPIDMTLSIVGGILGLGMAIIGAL